MLFPIAGNYEKSGNGGDQHLEDDMDWVSTNLMEVQIINGDDQKNFLTLEGKAPENARHLYVLLLLAYVGTARVVAICSSQITEAHVGKQ